MAQLDKQLDRVVLPSSNSHGRLGVRELSPYIWEKVFNVMPLQEQFKLALAGQFFHSVFRDMICPRMCKRFNLMHLESLNWAEIEQLLKALGTHTKELEVPAEGFHWLSRKHEAFQRRIKKYLLAVTCLRVLGQRPQVAIHYCFALDYVTELELYSCKLFDRNIKEMRAMRNLKALGLAKNRNITGKYIDELHKLHKLSMFQCAQVTATHLISILAKHNFSYLDIRLINYSGRTGALLKQLRRVEQLKVDVRLCRYLSVDPLMFAEWAHLTALELDVRLFADRDDFLITQMLQSVNSELHELRLTTRLERITEELLHAISALRQLRVLHLRNYHVDQDRRRHFHSSITALGKLEELAYHESQHGINLVLPMMPHLPNLGRLSVSAESGFCLNDFRDLIDFLRKRAKQQNTPKPLIVNVCGQMAPRRLLDQVCKEGKGVLVCDNTYWWELSGSLFEKW